MIEIMDTTKTRVEKMCDGDAFNRIDSVRKGVELDKKTTSLSPRNYLTHTEFVKKCNAEIDEMCKEYGILQ